MKVRVGIALATVLGAVAFLAAPASPKKATQASCTGGRYVITGTPRTTGKATPLRSGSLTMRNATIAFSAGCVATPVKTKRGKKGSTKVRARWATCSGVKGKVRLKANIDRTCKRMWGSISSRKSKSRFDAELSLCGNGVVDAGEQCDGASCASGAACSDSCECATGGVPGPGCNPLDPMCPGEQSGSTTTTLVPGGGGGVTTTSLPGGVTTTSLPGGVTTTTLPSDHFKCYQLRGSAPHPGAVTLNDQFGATLSSVEEPERLCNPVDKNGEGLVDPTAHLNCYDLAKENGFVPRDVVVRNQFGDQKLTVVSPDSLCVPAEKDGVASELNLNHFKCYRVAQQRGQHFTPRQVSLADQFESKATTVQKPVLMCNPVSKNGEPILDPTTHLTCYRIVDSDGAPTFVERDVSVEDQFSQQLVHPFRGTCRKASLLCVPSLKNPGSGTTTTTLVPVSTTTSTTTVGTTSTSTSSTSTTSTTATTTPGATSTTSTTLGGGTTSTSSTTSTTAGGGTTSTSVGGGTTSTSTTSSAAVPTTIQTTSTSSTTATTAGAQCCNGAGFVGITTADQPGDCGEISSVAGTSINLECSGLYTGGGGNSVPLPYAIPDLGQAVSQITQCTGQTATLGGTTSAQTGSNRNCTGTGCLFGAPLSVPNPATPPTSVCVLNRISGSLSGSVDCSTGATNAMLPLGPIIYLTGDASTDPSSTIPGVQPCPLCQGMTCIGGPNNGMACIEGTSDLGDDYPTSHDCPPDPMTDIGTLPIAFALTTGTIRWEATPSTNDTETEANQSRVFSGFCRDADITTNFGNPARQCWENGMAVGSPCTQPNETCEQRSNGAFGPGGGGTRTILAIGNSMSILGGPAPGTLVSVFSIPPTFNSTVDAAGDLPGPGAVAIPGTARLCTDPMDCD